MKRKGLVTLGTKYAVGSGDETMGFVFTVLVTSNLRYYRMHRIGDLWNCAQQDTIFRGHFAENVWAPHKGAADSPRRICRFVEKNQPMVKESVEWPERIARFAGKKRPNRLKILANLPGRGGRFVRAYTLLI